MERMTKWFYLAAGGIGALAIAGVSLFVYTNAADAAGFTQATTANVVALVAPQITADQHGGGGRGGHGVSDEGLAEALGITVEELQAAYTEANTAAINQAVEDGLITQAQADELLASDRLSERGLHVRGVSVEYNTLLADALGITVEELDAAKLEAQTTAINAAVTAGTITQEQADQMLAQVAVQPYLEEAYSAALDEALANAVADGAITQEQADALRTNLESGHSGFGFGGGHGGRGGHHGGPGGFNFDGMPPAEPTDDASGS